MAAHLLSGAGATGVSIGITTPPELKRGRRQADSSVATGQDPHVFSGTAIQTTQVARSLNGEAAHPAQEQALFRENFATCSADLSRPRARKTIRSSTHGNLAWAW